MKNNSPYIRYFLSNHISGVKINNVLINSFIRKFSKSINVYNSGIITKYTAGPISQDIIFNAAVK